MHEIIDKKVSIENISLGLNLKLTKKWLKEHSHEKYADVSEYLKRPHEGKLLLGEAVRDVEDVKYHKDHNSHHDIVKCEVS